MIPVMHSFVKMTSFSYSRLNIILHDPQSEAKSQLDNGRVITVWEKAAQDLNRQSFGWENLLNVFEIVCYNEKWNNVRCF